MDLSNIINKLNSNKQFKTEEETKNGLILPMFMKLGYDVFDTDEFKPEVSADVGAKQGEKVDYAIYIKGQPVMIIECKQRDKKLDSHINQLYRYFTTIPDMHLALLTNGDDYWFFTDSERPNIMDLEPYMKLRLSTADETELEQLKKYTKENITKLDLKKDMKWQAFNDECDRLVEGLYSNNIPNYIIKAIASEAGTSIREMNQYNMADILYKKLIAKFNGYGVETEPIKASEDDVIIYLNRRSFGMKVDARALFHCDNTITILKGSIVSTKVADNDDVISMRNKVSSSIKDGVVIEDIVCASPSNAATIVIGNSANGWAEWKDVNGVTLRKIQDVHNIEYSEDNKEDGQRKSQKEIMAKNKANRSNIKLNHEYVYNDYTDGDWTYHVIDYYRLFGKKIDNGSARSMLIDTLSELMNQGKIKREEIINNTKFNGSFAILDKARAEGKGRMYYLEEHDIYVNTSHSIHGIVLFITKLFELADIRDENLLISFKE